MRFQKTFGQLAEERLEARDVTYDFAIPQPVFNDLLSKSGLSPNGCIVWVYDGVAPFAGRAFPLTLQGWQILVIAGYIDADYPFEPLTDKVE